MLLSHDTSNSYFYKNKQSPITNKDKEDYELLHYFDDQSDNESNDSKKSKSKSKNKNKKNEKDSFISNSNSLSSSSDDEGFIEIEQNPENVIEKSPDGNYGKVLNYLYNQFILLFIV